MDPGKKTPQSAAASPKVTMKTAASETDRMGNSLKILNQPRPTSPKSLSSSPRKVVVLTAGKSEELAKHSISNEEGPARLSNTENSTSETGRSAVFVETPAPIPHCSPNKPPIISPRKVVVLTGAKPGRLSNPEKAVTFNQKKPEEKLEISSHQQKQSECPSSASNSPLKTAVNQGLERRTNTERENALIKVNKEQALSLMMKEKEKTKLSLENAVLQSELNEMECDTKFLYVLLDRHTQNTKDRLDKKRAEKLANLQQTEAAPLNSPLYDLCCKHFGHVSAFVGGVALGLIVASASSGK